MHFNGVFTLTLIIYITNINNRLDKNAYLNFTVEDNNIRYIKKLQIQLHICFTFQRGLYL